MIEADFVLRGAGLLATLAPRTEGAGLGLIRGGALAARAGRIVWVGEDAALAQAVAPVPDAHVVDAEGAAVVPGFVDAHTHLVFAGDRDEEITRRLAGATYQEIAAGGGGIVRSVDATRAESRAGLAAAIELRLDEMLMCGTTTAEVKSGYGLSTEAEIRSLEALRDAAARHPVSVVPTFLGAHEVPPEHRANRGRYVDLVVTEMLPEVARRGLARFCDVFCETGVFTVEESRKILLAARDLGLGLRVHADELGESGGAELAGELGAHSADHLVFVSERGIAALADAGCVATVLPVAAFYLRLGRFAPARRLLEAGVPLAIATDGNPGGGLSPSMPFAMTVACFGMGLSLEQALVAATRGGARSVGREADVGTLEVGKSADLAVLRSARLLDLLRVGIPAVRHVVKSGRVVVRDGARTSALSPPC